MTALLNLLHNLYQEANILETGSATSISKAMIMSEMVYKTIDTMRSWSPTQQHEALVILRSCLATGTLDDLSLPQDHKTTKIELSLIQAILDKAPIELGLQ